MDNELIVNEKERKKEKRKLYRDIVFIVLFGLIIFWFTASYLSNINNVDKEEDIKIELIDTKSLNKSKSIDYSLSSDIRHDGDIYLTYDFVDLNTYSPLSTIQLYSSLSVVYNIYSGSYNPYMYINFYFYDDSIDFEIDESYELTSQFLVDSNISESSFNFTFTILDGEIDPSLCSVYLSSGDYYQGLIPSTYPNLLTTYNGVFEISNVLYIRDITEEIQFIESISYSYYELGYDEGLEEGYTEGSNVSYQEGYDNGYQVGFVNGQKDNINEKGFKTLFNAIMNAPYNIFKGILNFEFLGVNLFSLFSFIFTTMLILWIVKIFKK